MLELLRRYQKVLFIIVATMVVFSFVFFGTYSTLGTGVEKIDRQVGKTLDGSSMKLSEVQQLSRFIATDREDSASLRGTLPNLCNDGVIRYDFIRDGIANLLVSHYFDALKEDLESRLDRAKRFKSYVHPEASFLSAQAVWDYFLPDLNAEIAALQGENSANIKVFSHLEKLYQYQSRLQPEMLRQILLYQHRQYPQLHLDQRLTNGDLALFGFHSASDWFGRNFIDLVSEFILNAAAAAEMKNYHVTLQEAKGDLIHRFQESMQKFKEPKLDSQLSFHGHLKMLGFDEKSATEVWRKVLLFRKYFQDVGETAFIDQLPFKEFAGYTQETAVVDLYRWPILVSSLQDEAELQYYIRAISSQQKNGLPVALLPIDEVEKKCPELVQKTVKAKVAEVSKKELSAKPSIKQVWDWQIENWDKVSKQFSLPIKTTREEKFITLEESPKRDEIDAWSRLCMVDDHPAWIEEALAQAEFHEKTWNVIANKEPSYKRDGFFSKIEDLEILREKHILPFKEARAILSKKVSKTEGEFNKDKTLFAKVSKEALTALQQNRDEWVQQGCDPLVDQFRLEKKEQTIQRTSKEDWMREQAFMIMPQMWSSIHIADNGDIVFFYLQEKRIQSDPILEQLAFGKETLAADAKLFVTEGLLKVIKEKNAIVIPAQREDE